ncbi:MAG: MATE family efflux transporter [Clostridia bacterium]|nr:MATE family efflux transporter [Clostridia bacterium]
MNIQLSDHFTYKKLLRFTLPSIAMMIFTSVYGVVDGFFVSNFVGKVEFTAVNFIMPLLMILSTVGFMLGTGGSALIGKTLGEGDKEKANRQFSLIVYAAILLSVIISVAGLLILRPVAYALGAEGELLDDCVTYGRIILLALPFFTLQVEFQSLFVTAEKPTLGLYMTLVTGVANMVLDAVLVGILPLGLEGAALATALSQAIGGVVPLIYFAIPNSSLLRLGKTKYDGQALLRTCTNGSSELMSTVSMSLVGMLYNIQLLKYAGEDGVAAYGVLMYVNMVFVAIFFGYTMGMAPVTSFHYGANNTDELKSLLKKSLVIVGISSVLMVISSILLAKPLSLLFASNHSDLLAMTVRGFYIYSFSFLFSGLAIFGSSFFTALNNGLVSASISFLRTLVFQIAAVMLLPLVWGLDGIWVSVVVAEFAAAALSVIFIFARKNKYHYL